MSTNANRFSAPFVLYLIVLIGLIYMFRSELFVTGIRLYVTAVHNPKAEQLLGDYYENSAQLSNELSKSFYVSAMKKYKDQLPTASNEQQAVIKLRIGQLYLCGKGVEANTSEAKQWLNEALSLATANAKPQVVSDIKQSLTYANESNKKSDNGKPNMIQPCHLQSESEFFNLLP